MIGGEPTSDKHYEEKFEFPLWKMIKKRAEEDDTSYVVALNKVLPEYVKTIRYGDEAFENAIITERWTEMKQVAGGDVIMVDVSPKEKGD